MGVSQTLAYWRNHATTLEAVVSGQQQRLATLEAQLSSLQASSAKTKDLLESALNEHSGLLHAARGYFGGRRR